jgi:hypothetical protein
MLLEKKVIWAALKSIFKILFTALLLYLVFNQIDLSQLKNVFKHCQPQFLIAASIAYLLLIIISSWRLYGYLRDINIEISPATNLKMYFIGLFYNVFLPGGLGGEGYKIYLLHKRSKEPVKRIFSAIFFDRLSGLWSIGFIIVVLVILIPHLAVPALPLAVLFVSGTALYYILMKKFFADYAQHFFRFHGQALVAQSLQMLCVVLILYSQTLSGNFAPYLFGFLLSSLATIVPISVGGFGLREIVMVQGSGYLNMNAQIAVFTTLSFSLLSTILSLPGLWYIYRLKY